MIPFLDLKAQYAGIKDEIDSGRARVSSHPPSTCWATRSPPSSGSSPPIAGREHAVAVNTGTSALHLALLAAGIGPGDEVITVPFTFVATVAAIRYAGATPGLRRHRPGDLHTWIRRSWRRPSRRAPGPSCRSTSTARWPTWSRSWRSPARHGLPVIEDACQAHGATYGGRRAGSLGLSGCFSFYPGKNLGACGEGGMVVTNDAEQARQMRMLRDWGQEQRYHHVVQGLQLPHGRHPGRRAARQAAPSGRLDRGPPRARRVATTSASRIRAEVAAPTECAGRRHVYHVYAVRTRDRAALQHRLSARGVQTGLHYPIPVHLQQAYADLGYGRGDFPESERAADEVLSLPIYPEMTPAQIDEVSAVIDQVAHAA